MLNTVGTIVDRLDDSNSLLLAGNATAGVTSNPDQMPTSNQETGSVVLERMGEKIKKINNLDDENTNETIVIDVTTTMLGAGSNIFDAACKAVPQLESLDSRTDPHLLVNMLHFY
jgi:hypothetical protein